MRRKFNVFLFFRKMIIIITIGCYPQVQVYWSESPKAKFVKQGEVDQVKFKPGTIQNFLNWESLRSCQIRNNLTSRFPLRQNWPSATKKWNGLSKMWWADLSSAFSSFRCTLIFARSARKGRNTQWLGQTEPSPSLSKSRRPLTLDDTSSSCFQNRISKSKSISPTVTLRSPSQVCPGQPWGDILRDLSRCST